MEDNYLLDLHPSGDEESSPEDIPELTLEEIRELLPEIAESHTLLSVEYPLLSSYYPSILPYRITNL